MILPEAFPFTLRVLGRSLVTPLGGDPAALWSAVRQGQVPEPQSLAYAGLEFPVYRTVATLPEGLARHPRLRRASAISQFAAAAAVACLQDAGLPPEALADPEDGLVFATSDGSVVYTRKFFEGVEKEGPGHGSPLLFPETVYNAPASHVCALLGLTGPSLSLVGDAAVGLAAVRAALQLLITGQCRRVLVVAAEELDSVALAGYAAWHYTACGKTESKPQSAIFSEGAAALLLDLPDLASPAAAAGAADLGYGDGRWVLRVGPSRSFQNIRQGARHLATCVEELIGQHIEPDLLFPSSAGAWSGRWETRAIATDRPRWLVKKTLGEGLAAATLWQIILAAEALREAHTPSARALVTVLGYNGETGVAMVQKG